jgi:NAD(P) transhydrogenase subunit beta
MNVLLSEAGVDYDGLLTEVDDANAYADRADVALIIGANDIVNPDAKDTPGSPIYGMPIIDVRNAGTTIVMKRSMASGYAGVENPLFFHDRARMLFGDAKQTLAALVQAVKMELGVK